MEDLLCKINFSCSLIHVLPWGGVVGAQQKLREAMKLPNLSTGEMQNLLPPLTDAEEEMFRNMMRRLHTIFTVATFVILFLVEVWLRMKLWISR